MFDLKIAYLSTYNAKTGLYARKDGLLKLIPKKGNAKLITKVKELLPSYPANLIVQIITEGYPVCPVCGNEITKRGTGDKAREFIKTCGRPSCKAKYQGYTNPINEEKRKNKLLEIQEYLHNHSSFVLLKTFKDSSKVLIKCTDCNREYNAHLSRLKQNKECQCHVGKKVAKIRALKPENRKIHDLRSKKLKSDLSSYNWEVSKIHPIFLKAKIKCRGCNKVKIINFCDDLENVTSCHCKTEQRSKRRYMEKEQQFLKQLPSFLKKKKLELVNEYKHLNTRIKVRCLICNSVRSTYPYRLQPHNTNEYGCKVCSTIKSAPERLEISKKTCIKRYGVPYSSQFPIILNRLLKSRYIFRSYKLGNRTVKVQGYEPLALDYILERGVKPDNIVVGTKNVPIINYDFDGKSCKYFPDIYIPSKNLLIEVKSTHTYACDYDRNIAKAKAAKSTGYSFRFLIMNEDGTRVSTKKMNNRIQKGNHYG